MKTRDLVLGKIKKNPVDSYKDEPTKPSKLGSVGFDGSLSHESGEKKENDTTEPNPVSTLKTEPLAESFLSEMNEAPTFLALLQITDRIDPSRFTQDEFDELWEAYCRNRNRWPDEAFPATGWGTLNEVGEESLPDQDPVELAERVALKFEADTPSIPGRPIIVDRGVVLACENDLPHVKAYAWALLHLNTGQARTIDLSRASRDCRLTIPEIREAIEKLLADGDLVAERTRKGEQYKLHIQYRG